MSDASGKKDKDKTATSEAVEVPKKGGGLMPVILILNSLLLVGVLVFSFLQMRTQTAMLETLSTSSTKKAPAAHAEGEGEPAEEHPPAEEGEGHGSGPAKEGEHGEAGGDAAAAHDDKELAALPAARVGPLVKIPDFVVHLRNPDTDRYARMSFDVEVFTEGDKDRLNAAMPKVRDAFIGYLSDRTLEDLRGSEGLSRTKDALQNTLRQLVPMVRIRALYISDFVIQ